ncbi:MAG TPA: hypothetical protein VGL22_18970 [Terracidiphilus sp.]
MKQLIEVAGSDIRILGRRLRTAKLEAEFYHFLSDPERVIAALRGLPNGPDLFTFIQGAADPAPSFKYHMEWDNLALIPVSSFEHWWTKQLDSKARNQMRLAEKKGVVLREAPFNDELVRGIQKIYNETRIRQGRPFPHFGKDFETIYREEATFLEHSIFLGAYLGDELIGFIKLVMDEQKTQAGMMNILSLINQRDKAPNNALIAEAVRVCAARGIPNLVYFRFVHGKRERDGISDFKTNCGFRRVDVPRYYVPLTLWGHAALRLGLHNRLRDRIPEPVAERLRELKKKWHAPKSSSLPANTGAQP